MKLDSSPDSSRTTSSSVDPEFRVKQRHLEARIFYTDYDIVTQKKLTTSAKDVIQTIAEKGVESEEAFFHEVANSMKDSLNSFFSPPEIKKWNVIVGNEFGTQADAVKGSIAFFAIGDVKLLVYRT